MFYLFQFLNLYLYVLFILNFYLYFLKLLLSNSTQLWQTPKSQNETVIIFCARLEIPLNKTRHQWCKWTSEQEEIPNESQLFQAVKTIFVISRFILWYLKSPGVFYELNWISCRASPSKVNFAGSISVCFPFDHKTILSGAPDKEKRKKTQGKDKKPPRFISVTTTVFPRKPPKSQIWFNVNSSSYCWGVSFTLMKVNNAGVTFTSKPCFAVYSHPKAG